MCRGIFRHLRILERFEIKGWQDDECLSMYIITTIPHGKCLERYLRTCCFYIRNLTGLLRSFVQFLIRQQLVRKYHTPALSMKTVFSMYYIVTSLVCILTKQHGVRSGKYGMKTSGNMISETLNFKMYLDALALTNLCLWCKFQSRLLFIISLLLKNLLTALTNEWSFG